MMKRICTILLVMLLGAVRLPAQTPRAVIKAIYKADDREQVDEKYSRTVRSNPEDDASMRLMRAAYLNYIGTPVDAYYTYCKNRKAIEADPEIAKMLKSLQLRLVDIFSGIESASSREILRQDTESAYDDYIEVARENANPALDVLCTARESRAFSDAVAARTVAACDRFLTRYPDATDSHVASVKALRADLRYADASASTDEAFIEAFLEEYPSYRRNASLKDYLADLRYARVSKSGTVEDMKWFCSLYPAHPGTPVVRRMLSELEYESLDKESVAAVRAYLSEYPDAAHAPELSRWADFTEMMQTADLGTIFRYIGSYGYDSDYPAMVRAIASMHGAVILTPDITEVDMVRFRDAKGRVGYWDMDGRVAVAPRYDMLEDSFGHFRFDAVFTPEFLKGRGCAAVRQNGKVGAINRQGAAIVPLKGERISIADEIVLMAGNDGNGPDGADACDRYSFAGAPLGSGVFEAVTVAPCSRRAGIAGVKAGKLNSIANVSLGADDYRHVLTRDGIALLLEAREDSGRICAYTDRYISTSKGIVDASNWSVLGPDVYDSHEFIKEGRVLVCRGGLWGYLDEKLSVVIQPSFLSAESFCGGAALVRDSAGAKLIARDGTVLFKAAEMKRLSSGPRAEWDHYALYAFRDGDRWGVVDSGACVLLEPVEADDMALDMSEGAVECIRAGRTRRYDLTELISNATR